MERPDGIRRSGTAENAESEDRFKLLVKEATGLDLDQIPRGTKDDLSEHIIARCKSVFVVGIGYPDEDDETGEEIYRDFRVVDLAKETAEEKSENPVVHLKRLYPSYESDPQKEVLLRNLSDLFAHGQDLYEEVLSSDMRRVMKRRNINPSLTIPLSEAQKQYIQGWKLHRDLMEEFDGQNLKHGTEETDQLFDQSLQKAKELGDWAALGWFDVPDMETEELMENWPDQAIKKFEN